MPIYEYQETETGLTFDAHFPVGKAPDAITFRRVTVPRRVGTIVGAKPPSMGEQLMGGFRALEEAGKLNDHNPNYLR